MLYTLKHFKDKKLNPSSSHHISYDKILFLFILLLLFLRAPQIILHGRFWGEEATIFFKHAVESGILKSIFYVYFRTGYLYLSANISVVLATLVPLEYAPLVTTVLSFLITALILYAIYFVPSHLFEHKYTKIWFVLLMVLGAHVVAEVYCNSINTQVYWGMYGILFLFFDLEQNKKNSSNVLLSNKFLYILLLMGNLSGLYCVVLYPFYVIKYILTKKDYDKTSLKIITIPVCIQTIIVIYSKFFANLATNKINVAKINWEGLTYSIKHCLIRPLFGIDITNNISDMMLAFVAGLFVLLMFVSMYFNWKNDRKKFKLQVIIVALFCYIFIYVMVGALGDKVGGRYAFIPASLILLELQLCIETLLNRIFICLLLIPLIFGSIEFQGHANYVYLDYASSPKWDEQVEQYNLDNNFVFQTWPYHKAGWEFQIKNNH